MGTFRLRAINQDQDLKLGFFVRSAGHFRLEPPDRESIKVADFGEIFWCVDGCGIFELDGKQQVVRPGFVWYYPPGSFHSYIPGQSGFEYYWLTVAGKDAAALFEGLAIKVGLNYGGNPPVQLFNQIIKRIFCSHTRDKLQNLCDTFELLSKVTLSLPIGTARKGVLEAALALCDNHYKDPEFNVELAASMLNIHRGSLSRTFSAGYGMPISQYITKCRLQCAIKILQETDIPISETAWLSGFSSAAYFIRIFRAHTGETPAAFRKLYRKVSRQDSSCQ